VIGYVPVRDLGGASDGVRAIAIIVDGRTLQAGDPGYPARTRE
jgi:hypothetical protein